MWHWHKPHVWLPILLLVLPLRGMCQRVFQKNESIPVTVNNQLLQNPWVGGLNCPQFIAADLNNDGKDDLIIFDRGYFSASNARNGSRLLTFINTGTAGQVSYTYAPAYEAWFPSLSNWMKLIDFNCDGVLDIFSSSPGQIDLYMGSRDSSGRLHFTYRNYLQYNAFSGPSNIYASSVDIPGIYDVNGDGDLDVVSFEQQAYTLNYFENQSQELTHTCGDTIVFEQKEDCWGKIQQTGVSAAVTFKDTCGTYWYKTQPGGLQRHNGNTVLLLDANGDHLTDLILGDIYYNNLDLLLNGGKKDSAKMVAQDTAFPANTRPIALNSFPASFYLDVNNDGKKDIIAAPNANRISADLNCAWYYKNVSTNDTLKLQFVTDSFMVNTMLDFGEGSVPRFFDYNNDGLMDLVVGNFGYFDSVQHYHSGLALLQNIGTPTLPAFKLITRDYMGLSTLTYLNKRVLGMIPTFGDLDGDGDMDMIVGDTSGKLHYFVNNPVAGVANFTLANSDYFGIDVGDNSAPFLYDVNGDGLLDLLIGRKQGSVYYYENRGTAQQAQFDAVPTNNFFGHLDARYAGFTTGYSKPLVTKLDTSNRLYLMSGNEEGRIIGYLMDSTKIYGGAFKKVFDYYSGIHEGDQSAITVADIDHDGKMEMMLGNYRGGLVYFKQIDSLATWLPDSLNSIATIPTDTLLLKVYPNPANTSATIEYKTNETGLGYLIGFNSLGQEAFRREVDIAGGIETIELSGLTGGIYQYNLYYKGRKMLDAKLIIIHTK